MHHGYKLNGYKHHDTCITDTCIMDTCIVEACIIDIRIIDSCIIEVEKGVLVNFAWVTRPERPKGAKDEVKRPEKGLHLEIGARRAPRLLVD